MNTQILTVGFLLFTAVFTCSAQPQARQAPNQLRPQQPQRGPWNNDLMMRWSSDGQSFGPETVFVECGGVPSTAANEKGVLVAAFQWFPLNNAEAFDRVAVRFSETGGVSWTDPVPIQVSGMPTGYQRPFDPTIVAVPGKGYRMYFSSGPKGAEPPGSGPNIATYSAISSDGLRYQFEPGARFRVEGHKVIDCAVAHDGSQWRYTAPVGAPQEGAYSAVSSDGLSFTRLETIPSDREHNWTGNLIRMDGRLRFYGASRQGIWWSRLEGQNTWSPPTLTDINGGDPAVARGKDGKYFIIYVSPPRRYVQRPGTKG